MYRIRIGDQGAICSISSISSMRGFLTCFSSKKGFLGPFLDFKDFFWFILASKEDKLLCF